MLMLFHFPWGGVISMETIVTSSVEWNWNMLMLLQMHQVKWISLQLHRGYGMLEKSRTVNMCDCIVWYRLLIFFERKSSSVLITLATRKDIRKNLLCFGTKSPNLWLICAQRKWHPGSSILFPIEVFRWSNSCYT